MLTRCLFFTGGDSRFIPLLGSRFRSARIREDHDGIGGRNNLNVISVRIRRRKNHIRREGHFRKALALLSVCISLLAAGSRVRRSTSLHHSSALTLEAEVFKHLGIDQRTHNKDCNQHKRHNERHSTAFFSRLFDLLLTFQLLGAVLFCRRLSTAAVIRHCLFHSAAGR